MDILQPLQDAFGTFLNYIPQLLGALVVLLIGYIVAKLVGAALSRILTKVGFDKLMGRAGVTSFLERTGTNLTPAKVFGKIAFWFVFLIAFTMFASALGVPQISGFLNQMIGYVPRIFAAIAIVCLGVLLANFLAALIRGATRSDALAKVGRYATIVYAAFAALTQLGIAVQLTGSTVLIALGALGLAAAIAFGWGGRGLARDVLQRAFGGYTGQSPGGAHAERAPMTAPPAAPMESAPPEWTR